MTLTRCRDGASLRGPVACVLFAVLTVLALAGPAPAVNSSANGFLVADEASACRAATTKKAVPEVVLVGEAVEVALKLGLDCPGEPVGYDVVLAFDRSTSMLGQPLANAKAAAHRFIDHLDLSPSRMGLVTYSDWATQEVRLTSRAQPLHRAIDRIEADGSTDIPDALREAGRMLDRDGSANLPVILLMSDGKNSTGPDAVRQQAALQRAAGRALLTVAIGPHADTPVMRDIASTPGDAFEADRSGDLPALYERVAARLDSIQARSIEIEDAIPDDMRYVPGSARPPAEDRDGVLVWRAPFVAADGLRLTYRVRPTQLGLRPTNLWARSSWVDSSGRSGSADFPVPQVLVVETLPTTTPTPTATASPTPTPSQTPRASETPPLGGSATQPPAPTATPHPTRDLQIAFLPIALQRACPVVGWDADVVLILDASTTMASPVPGGGRKIDAAKAGALDVAHALNRQGKRVSLVTFNSGAQVLSGFGDSPEAMATSLAQLELMEGSRIDLGLARARRLLAEAGRQGVRRFVILVSDGKPVGAPADVVVGEAAALRDAATLLTVALGADADRQLLASLASPGMALDGGDGEGLNEALRHVIATLDCR